MENVLILISLIVGVALQEQLTNLHRLLRDRHEIRWDGLPLIVALFILLSLVMVWWSVAQPREEPISIGEFLPKLTLLIFLFLLAAASLPNKSEKDVTDLRIFYHNQGSYIWTIFSLAMACLTGTEAFNQYIHGTDLLHVVQARADEIVILAIMVSLIFIRWRWFHYLALIILAAGPINWLSRTLG